MKKEILTGLALASGLVVGGGAAAKPAPGSLQPKAPSVMSEQQLDQASVVAKKAAAPAKKAARQVSVEMPSVMTERQLDELVTVAAPAKKAAAKKAAA